MMLDKIRANLEDHRRTVEMLTNEHVAVISRMSEMIAESLGKGGKLLLAGNGGSAADAQHVAGEFVGRLVYDRRPLPAIALSTDTSVLTCVGNDYGFDDVFLRQTEALAAEGDVFWGFSTSGQSGNVVAAAKAAKAKGARVLAFTGEKGGALAEVADVTFRSPASRTMRIQEVHMLAYHIICQLVEESLCPR